MKLHWSPRSPFVRKVMIAAHELGLADRITCVRTVVATTRPHAALMDENPLSKIPTLVLDDGTVLYDSPVICEYLDSPARGAKARSGRPPGPPDRAAPAGARRRLSRFPAAAAQRARARAAVGGASRDLHHEETGRARGARAGSRRARRLALQRRPHRDRLRAVLSRFQVCRRGLASGASRHRPLAPGILPPSLGARHRAGRRQ